jgi:ubiquinone biosynthesis protein
MLTTTVDERTARRRFDARLLPERFRRWLERRGPSGIKLGQFLALRPDLVPQEYCDELLRLVDQAPHFPWLDVERIVIRDLGRTPDEAFAWIARQPFAAGSLAQVHAARTHDGAHVAVKVQREGIHEQIRKDLQRARWVARVLRLTGVVKVISAEEVVDEFDRWLGEELDFERELHNVTRLHRLNAGRDAVRIPRPRPELCGRRVVTVEWLRGLPFSEVLWMASHDRADDLAAQHLGAGELADSLLTTVVRQMFEDQFFHADVHPGNLIALPGNAVGFVDFGLVEPLDDTLRAGMAEYLDAVRTRDIERIYKSLVRDILVPADHANLEAFHADLLAAARTWQREIAIDRPPGERPPLARCLMDLVRSARRNGLRIPVGVLAMYRTLLTAETIATQLDSRIDLTPVAGRFFVRWQVRRTLASLNPEQLIAFAVDALALLRDSPGHIGRLLADLADDRFVLRVQTTASADDRRLADARARLITTAICALGLVILLVGSPSLPWLASSTARGFLVAATVAVAALMAALWRRLS